MTDYYQVTIPTDSETQLEILVACLAEAGFEGFEEDGQSLKAFIAETAYNEDILLSVLDPHGVSFTRELIRQTNWNQEWEEGFSPVVVGTFCAVRANFHEPVKGVQYELVVTPKMSFGTGHHATTYMMIEAMSNTDFSGKTVLDFGTGTGVLAILADKMGAASVEAIDNDEWSINNGVENAQQNECTHINLYLSDTLVALACFDVILANINKNVILLHLPEIRKHLQPAGTVVFSGLLTGDLPDLQAALSNEGWAIAGMQEKNGWICVQVVNG